VSVVIKIDGFPLTKWVVAAGRLEVQGLLSTVTALLVDLFIQNSFP
jgi:hypothetical protein